MWAAAGILAALWYAQSYRRGGGWPALVLSGISAGVAGGFWSAGHLAGPVAAVYLWFDGRRRCRLAAAVPLVATAVTVGLFLLLAARPMDSTVSFHGRTVAEAANPVQGLVTTAQAIPHSLVFANLGLDADPSPIQGIMLTLTLLAFWASRRWRRPDAGAGSWPSFAFNPLECAGAATVLGCYLLEWTFRGYLDYEYLRTINPYMIVPWYDLIPQVGAVLFAVGWWSGPRRPVRSSPSDRARPAVRRPRPAPPSRSSALAIATATLVLLVLNRPRVDALIRGTSPPLTASEGENFKIPRLQTMRANVLISDRVDWQRRYLRRLDQAEAVARRLGIGQDGIRAAFGFVFIPGSTGRMLQAHREHYDVAAILDLPPRGRYSDVAGIRAALGSYLIAEPEPRPKWLPAGEKWPPD